MSRANGRTQQQVMIALDEKRELLSVATIAARTGLAQNVVRAALSRLLHQNQVLCTRGTGSPTLWQSSRALLAASLSVDRSLHN